MRGFLKKQKEDHPPRMDSLLADTKFSNPIKYPTAPVHGKPAIIPQKDIGDYTAEATADIDVNDDCSPHIARHPRFLSRAREHMSRRLHDVHVRRALEDKVEQTKAELEAQSRSRLQEARQWEEGMLVNDALRYDCSQAKATERRRHADYLRSQISEGSSRQDREREDRHAEIPGYYGPEEKEVQGSDLHR